MANNSIHPNSGALSLALARFAHGRARVIDLSYAINDHLPPWPGDKETFEARPTIACQSRASKNGKLEMEIFLKAQSFCCGQVAPQNGQTPIAIAVWTLLAPCTFRVFLWKRCST